MPKSNKYRGFDQGARIQDLNDTLSEVMKLPKDVRRNALLNTDEASDLASTGEGHAGATLNVHDFHLAKKGEDLTFVGGEKNAKGQPIPTEFAGGSKEPGGVARNAPFISPLSILQHAARIREATGTRRNSNVGLWLDPKNKRSGVQVDASAGYSTPEDAIQAMSTRPAEKAAWSMKNMEELKNPAYDATKDPKSKRFKG